MMMGFGMGFGWFGMFFSVIFWLVIIFAVLWLLSNQIAKQDHKTVGDTSETAVTILENRYARGELDKEEFDTIRHNLGH